MSAGITALQQLESLEPGKVPSDLFNAIARITVTPVIEIAPLRMSRGALSVLLCRRPEDDPVWPGQHHLPGTIIGANDSPGSYDDGFSRILSGKLGGLETTKPAFAGSELVKAARGTEIALVYWVEVLAVPNEHVFYSVEDLPSNMIEGHPEFILMAQASYLGRAARVW